MTRYQKMSMSVVVRAITAANVTTSADSTVAYRAIYTVGQIK